MRQLNNWLAGYLEYNSETESATLFHKWTGLSILAACLRKKISLSMGRFNVYPNLYVVLVGPAGGPRKSQAITYGIQFLANIPDIIMSADSITPQALIEDLEKSTVEEQMPNGSRFSHSSLTVTSKEFESFLGQKQENSRMITYLTDLFDAQELPWKYRTKHSGNNVIPSVFLNLLAATTPDSISNSLPSSAIGTGLTSRIMFVWAEKKAKKVPFPGETAKEVALRESLQNDLYIISRMVGTYQFSPACKNMWIQWYEGYDSDNPDRLCKDPIFAGWYERKTLYIQKLAMILAASESNSLIVEWNHFEQAIQVIEEVEVHMPHVFKAVGRSEVAADVDLVISIVKSKGSISEIELMDLVWRDIDDWKFNNVIATAMRAGKITRKFLPVGATVYKYVEQ